MKQKLLAYALAIGIGTFWGCARYTSYSPSESYQSHAFGSPSMDYVMETLGAQNYSDLWLTGQGYISDEKTRPLIIAIAGFYSGESTLITSSGEIIYSNRNKMTHGQALSKSLRDADVNPTDRVVTNSEANDLLRTLCGK